MSDFNSMRKRFGRSILKRTRDYPSVVRFFIHRNSEIVAVGLPGLTKEPWMGTGC